MFWTNQNDEYVDLLEKVILENRRQAEMFSKKKSFEDAWTKLINTVRDEYFDQHLFKWSYSALTGEGYPVIGDIDTYALDNDEFRYSEWRKDEDPDGHEQDYREEIERHYFALMYNYIRNLGFHPVSIQQTNIPSLEQKMKLFKTHKWTDAPMFLRETK